MLRGFSHVRRRVEQLATQAGSGRCDGDHQRHRVVNVANDDLAPPWPDRGQGERCACGATLEYVTIVHQHLPGDHPEAANGPLAPGLPAG